ncbi:hypothetical protein BKM31_47745 [[Actinomadura] parvosata subsp. kistnae]|uniref:Uncharacterized protein n=1 Tax=[Actinomadura] parvosata subsp. kistnae TaxID=1909395 RepID=A0A1V0AD44_9ACTN|nr:hypothetical protein [Nonomuraea sp. ATCC 55076]AQZ68144.1 hypothetical protein BKM31_47745 [Nonomuraea sp. ATCC 55076]
MTGFEIALGAVGRESERVGAHSGEYEAAVRRLWERGDSVASWADDGLFAGIVAAYAECNQVSLMALTGVSGEIGHTGEALAGVVANTRTVEDVNAENARRVTWA